MKLSSALEFLENNQGRKVRSVQGKKIKYMYVADGLLKLEIRDGDGKVLEDTIPRGSFNHNIVFNDNSWEILPKEVTFEEAMKAWKNGKTVEAIGCPGVDCGKCSKKIKQTFSTEFTVIQVCRQQANTANWYVKD